MKQFKWSKDVCTKEALKYTTIGEFIRNNKKIYRFAYKHGWRDEICSHMIINKWNKKHKWNKEKCAQIALKYDDRSDFRKYSFDAYGKSSKYGWFDEICLHMTKSGNLTQRCVYVYEFSDNYAYIGLTCNIKERKRNRINNEKDSVTEHINKTGLTPIVKQLTDYLDCDIAKKIEINNILLYKNIGWNILNKTLGGEIGTSGKKWAIEECQKEAMNFNIKTKFKENKYSIYMCAKRNGWLDNICDHMVKINRNRTEEDCKNIALKYKTKTEFLKNERGSLFLGAKTQYFR